MNVLKDSPPANVAWRRVRSEEGRRKEKSVLEESVMG